MNHCPLCKLPIVNGARIRCTCKLSERERGLPHWAQKEIDHLRHRLQLELERRQTLEAAHSVLKAREWYVLPGPTHEDTTPLRYLYWVINHTAGIGELRIACSLGVGDVLLIGRAEPRPRSIKKKGDYE
jgi:hypothetical protein